VKRREKGERLPLHQEGSKGCQKKEGPYLFLTKEKVKLPTA